MGIEVGVGGVEGGTLVVGARADGWAGTFDGGGHGDCGCGYGGAERCCNGLGGFGISVVQMKEKRRPWTRTRNGREKCLAE